MLIMCTSLAVTMEVHLRNSVLSTYAKNGVFQGYSSPRSLGTASRSHSASAEPRFHEKPLLVVLNPTLTSIKGMRGWRDCEETVVLLCVSLMNFIARRNFGHVYVDTLNIGSKRRAILIAWFFAAWRRILGSDPTGCDLPPRQIGLGIKNDLGLQSIGR